MVLEKQGTVVGVEYRDISDDEAGQRIDNFLLTQLKGVPRSRVYRLIRRGEVRVNKGRVRPTYRLQANDRVRIPPIRRMGPRADSKVAEDTREHLAKRVLYEDSRLLVLDKPPGIAVHGGSGRSFGVIEALRAARTDCRYLELVHRLDRDTSGCLLIAKKRSYLRSLHELLRSGGLTKNYLALVRDSWQQGTVLLENRIKTNKGKSGERRVRLDEAGKIATSQFRPVEDFRIATLMDVGLMTGRTHQIRVQATASGHPLAGDDKYGEKDFNRQMADLGLRRIFLHASSLSYEDPVSGEPRFFNSPLPDDLRAVLDQVTGKRG